MSDSSTVRVTVPGNIDGASSVYIANHVCAKLGHAIAAFEVIQAKLVEATKGAFLCTKCGLTMEEIRAGKMEEK